MPEPYPFIDGVLVMELIAGANGEPALRLGEVDDGETDPGDSKEPKGHGPNGVSAYRQAQRIFHALALGVIGALCEACRRAKIHLYREKSVIRTIGQPLFSAAVQHHERARCRGCGRIQSARKARS